MKKRLLRYLSMTILICLLISGINVPIAAADGTLSGTDYLASVMDQFHNTYDVYTDAFAAGNNFSAKGMIGHAPTIIENYTQDVHSGLTCIQASYTCGISPNWGGWYFMNGQLQGSERIPSLNWGNTPNAGIDLTGATELTFWAKGAVGGESVEFFCAGVGRNSNTGEPTNPYPDSSPKISLGYVTLNDYWTPYSIPLTGYDLSYVLGGFGWVTNDARNCNQDITFYIDDIQFDKPRLDEPRLLVSYKAQNSSYEFDSICRNVAYTYDNAMAIIAFLADGENERAGLIADALVYAQNHDRYYTDGRLRNGYQAGELILPPGWTPNGVSGTVRMPGWWDTSYTNWYEDQYCVSSNTGNMAWAMLALLSYYQIEGGSRYLTAVERMGNFIEEKMRDTRGNGGYMGGYEGWEPGPEFPNLTFKSTEHNLDLYAAFTRLYEITGEAKWQTRAQYAKTFVLSMWDGTEGKFWTGTDPDGVTTNEEIVPLDTQTWTILSILDLPYSYQAGLTYAEGHHKLDNSWGFDFNTDKDGIWYEGTSQVATAYMLTEQEDKAGDVLSVINAGRASNGALYASDIGGLTTGFDVTTDIPWIYYHREHVGATAWGIAAEKRVNPFWLGTANGTIPVPTGPEPESNTWVSASNMPAAKSEFVTGTVNGKIYAIGGSDYYDQTVVEYDPLTDTWTAKNNMDTWIESGASAVVNDKIYVIGGSIECCITDSVKEYDPATDTWSAKASMPTARCRLTASVVNGKIYAVGGLDDMCRQSHAVEEYDPATDTWTAKASMPIDLAWCTSAAVNGKIYVFGGSFFLIYDPVTDTWTYSQPYNACIVSDAKAIAVEEKIYLIGGSFNGSTYNYMNVYDTGTDTWSAGVSLPMAKSSHGAEYVNGSIYVIGGRDIGACTVYDTVERFIFE
ncbi:MAG: hypothetical protein ABFD25_12190 [Clostridiaceae bacterium]